MDNELYSRMPSATTVEWAIKEIFDSTVKRLDSFFKIHGDKIDTLLSWVHRIFAF